MKISKFLAFLALPLAVLMSSCEPDTPEYTLPSLEIINAEGTAVTAVNFEAAGGEQTFTVVSTRSWTASSTANWFGITPTSEENGLNTKKETTLTITAFANEETAARKDVVKFALENQTYELTINQAAEGQTALGSDLFYDNFDKGGQAQKGSSGWDTYMDGAGAEFCNPTPDNQANVAYTGTKLTVRSNSSNGSGGTHSNYEGSGINYLWFGTAPTNFTVSGISLAELEGNALTLSFGTERYEYNADDNTFQNNEFLVYISGDGQKWSQIEYTFQEGVNLNGKWNLATAQFNLKEVPESLSIYFTATVGSAYALDDLRLTAGGGGAEIDLSQGIAIGDAGGDQGGSTEGQPTELIEATIAEFLAASVSDNTWYKLTGEIIDIAKETYGNFTIKDATAEVYIYGMTNGWVGSNDQSFASIGLKVGDTVTLGTLRGEYKGTAQGGGNTVPAYYISHVAGEGGGTTEPEPEPEPGVGPYASDSPFVCTTDNSANAAYGLGDTAIDGNAVTGFKLGKSKQEGKFTSSAIGVSGDKYLNFYAIAWGAGGDKTIYYRVNGGEVLSQAIKANDGAAGNHPYTISVSASDHYSVLLSGLNETDVIEFSSNAAFDCAATTDYATRALFFGVKLTDEPIEGEGGEAEEPELVTGKTIAEFLAAADTVNPYELTGTIANIVSTDYGNFDLVDESGSVYIYGLYDASGAKVFESLGLQEGDKVTLQGVYTTYNNNPQIKAATYISHEAAGEGGGEEPEQPTIVDVTVAEFIAAAESTTQWYQLTGTIANIANTTYGNFDLVDESGSIYVYGLTATQVSSNDKSFSTLGLKEGDTLTLIGLRASYNGSAQVGGPAYYVSHVAAPEEEPEPEPELPEGAVQEVIVMSEQFSEATSFESGKTYTWGSFDFTFTQNNSSTSNYNAGDAGVRFYQSDVLAVNGGNKVISKIEFTTYGGKTGPFTADCGTMSANTVWEGESSTVTFTASAQVRFSKITIIYTEAEGGEGEGEGEGEGDEPTDPSVITATVAEFLAAAEDETVYELTGVISGNTKAYYGNFDLTDDTGTVYIYGLVDAEGCYVWDNLGLKVGDTITVQGVRTSYNSKPQMKNALYISHVAGPEEEPEPEPDLGEWAGRDDFNTVGSNASYIERITTAGWVGQYCAVQAGGASDSNPVLPSLLGTDPDTRAFCIKGAADAIGTITSPVLNGGIGKLKFTYGLAFTDKNGVDMDITIMQNGEAVKTINVKTACSKYEVQSFEQEVNVAGDFQIVFTNKCPSAASSGNKDRFSIWDVMWTNYTAE